VRHEIFIIATADVRRQSARKAYDQAVRDIERIERQLTAPLPKKFLRSPKPKSGKLKINCSVTKKQFIQKVEKIKEYILAGDVFQTVPSLRLELEPGVDPLNIYRSLRRVNPSPYMYFLRMQGLRGEEMTVLGSSPEMLVRVTGKKLEYRPIAGTRKRGKDEADDLRLEDELRHDEKERAEHVMLVDLGRNDVGRVSEFGTVKVRDLMFVERYSHVMHLVSAVEGTLRAGLTPVDALAACFPAGTLTGAPKVRAMEIIEEMEPVRRGIYGGSVLYADFAGNLDSCIAIRTMLMKGKKAYVQAGAGIVADSVPASEYQECLNKTRALVRAVELARSGE
jgi:anthranilate synthase component 1